MGSRNIIWRIIALALLCYSLLSFASASYDLARTEALIAELEHSVKAADEENAQLNAALEQGYDDERLRILARQRLGLVMPGELVFYFNR